MQANARHDLAPARPCAEAARAPRWRPREQAVDAQAALFASPAAAGGLRAGVRAAAPGAAAGHVGRAARAHHELGHHALHRLARALRRAGVRPDRDVRAGAGREGALPRPPAAASRSCPRCATTQRTWPPPGWPSPRIGSTHFEFGPAYQMVQPVIAYNTDNPAPRSVKDVVGKRIEVVKGSSGVERAARAAQALPEAALDRGPGGRQRGPAEPPVRRQDRLRGDRVPQPRRDAQLLSESGARLPDRRPRAAGLDVPQGRRSACHEPGARVLPAHHQRRHAAPADGALLRPRPAAEPDGHRELPRADAHGAAALPHHVQARAGIDRHRLAPARGARLPGIALGAERGLAHRRARPDDADQRDRRPHGRHRPARSAAGHPARAPATCWS